MMRGAASSLSLRRCHRRSSPWGVSRCPQTSGSSAALEDGPEGTSGGTVDTVSAAPERTPHTRRTPPHHGPRPHPRRPQHNPTIPHAPPSSSKQSQEIMRKFFARRPPAATTDSRNTRGSSHHHHDAPPRAAPGPRRSPRNDPPPRRPGPPSSSRSDVRLPDFLRRMPLATNHGRSDQRSRPGSPGLSSVSSSPPAVSTPLPQADVGIVSLTDFIRSMQLDHERKQQELKDAGPSSLPSWRLLGQEQHQKRLRDMRQQQRERRLRPVPEFARQVRHKPVYRDPKQQTVTLPAYPVALAEASLLFREKAQTLRRVLKRMGEWPGDGNTKNTLLEPATLELLALELDRTVDRADARNDQADHQGLLLQRRADPEAAGEHADNNYQALPTRAPVVTILGHVDHGKTSLMDSLRRRAVQSQQKDKPTKGQQKRKKGQSSKQTSGSSGDIAGTEAGGITQAISAFQVPLDGLDQAVTFLDTPGHAAFRAMRQSGSDAADIIVLVIAADDGVSRQTIEILEFYKAIVKEAGANGISLVVAMNKIDKPGVDVDEARRRIEAQLQEHDIPVEGIPSQYGSSGMGLPVEIYPVSAVTGEGLDDLIEGLGLQAEVMDLRADDSTGAEGLVMDARVDKGVGIVVDTIIRWGSIKKGDVVVSGTSMGKVRILKDMNNQSVAQGRPSQPIRIIGFDSVPKAGDPIVCVASEEEASDIVERRKALESKDDRIQTIDSVETELQSAGKHLLHHEWKEKLQKGQVLDGGSAIRIPVIIKADADGTLAAVRESLVAIGEESTHDLLIDPVRVGVGPILANDIQLAKEGGATIFAFNLKHEQKISSMANEEKVNVVTSKVIYSLLDEAKSVFANYLPAEPVEIVHGRGQVQAVFEIGGISEKVAGLRVVEGTLFKEKMTTKDGNKLKVAYRIIRDGQILSESTYTASSLKYFKDDVSEVARGKECGLSLADCSLFEEGDEIECFSVEMKREFV